MGGAGRREWRGWMATGTSCKRAGCCHANHRCLRRLSQWANAGGGVLLCAAASSVVLTSRPLVPRPTQVALYFRRFEEAEDAYRRMGRLDLAVAMRSRLGASAAW